jgi:diguanylate cyclase (GGDEF)-like protein/PAS domain S-box-containing protein
MAKKPPVFSKDKLPRNRRNGHQSEVNTPFVKKGEAMNESVFRKFIENLPVMFYAVTPTPPHTPIYISPTFETFGYPLDDWLTNSEIWDSVIHPDDRKPVLDGTREAMRRGESIDYEYRVICADGRVLWVRDRSCFIKNDNGQPLCWQGVIIDITERKEIIQALKVSETRYRQLFENANDIIYVHDLKGNYISINQAAEKIFGYTQEEALSMNMKDITAPEYLKLVKQKLSKKLDGTTGQTVYEVDCITKSGERISLEVNSSVIVKDGTAIAVQGIARDITERKKADDLRRESEEKFRTVAETASDAIITIDQNGAISYVNAGATTIFGYSADEMLGNNLTMLMPKRFRKGHNDGLSRYMNSGKRSFAWKAVELPGLHRDGRELELELSFAEFTKDGNKNFTSVIRDITERKQAEASLRNALSLFESTFESTADGIVVMSLDRKEIVTCNRKFVEMWKVDSDIVIDRNGKRLIEHVAGQLKNTDEFIQKLDEIYVDPHATITEILELKDGRIIERCSQPQLLEGKPIGRVACFRDITERNLAEEKLRYYALHDTLTDLPNRVQFMNHLRQAVERAEGNSYAKFAVLFLDLDRFKVINDSLGHAVGDKLLIAIAERLTAGVRPGDVVARLGGDEFVILLNRSGDTSEVVKVAERLQSKITEPFKIDNYEVFTSASIGIIVSGSMHRKAEDFLRDADAAMYRAKESGKARYEIFDRKMHVQNMNLLQVETDLRHAVERNEFEVLYQPIVDLTTGDAHEFEALIRWRHPIHGLVEPNEFVHVAEETGLIIQIGKWILDEACRQTAEWQRRFNLPLSISVNLSAKQWMHPTLSAQVKQVLSETGLDSNQLKLEVTESTVMEHSEKSLKVLSELDQLGVSLSTDDFGTGYSSLSYLQRFPFDRLKIDRSFINVMDENEKSRSIVKTILMLGENLNIQVVAEGIETASHLENLRSLGCRSGQGYLFSRPIDREAAEDFLAAGANVFANQPGLIFQNPTPLIEVTELQ